MEHIQRLAVIAVLNLIVYYRTLFFGYVGDDVERAERPQEFKNIFHRWWIQFVGLKHRNSMVAHLITLLTHTACCLAIYFAFGCNNLSFLTALLFSINPVNIQGSIWISGRNYVTSTILALLMFAMPKMTWFFYMATCYFAVNAWFTPLAFLGTSHWYWAGIIPLVWLIHPSNKATIHRKLWETAGLKTTNTEMRSIKPKKIIPFLKTYLYYFVLAIIPWRIGVEHNFLRGFGTNSTDNQKGYKIDIYLYLGLILALAVAFCSISGLIWGWKPLTLGLFWFSVNIAMFCNFVTYQQQLAERYTYLANVGIMYALASVIINYPVLITAFLVGYLVRLWYVQEMYLNDYWAVEHTIIESKKMHYMWLMRGVKKFMVKDYVGSLFDFNEALIHKPYDLKILFNLATTYFMLGDVVKSREFLEKARKNIYDELSDTVTPTLDNLEKHIIEVEKAKAEGKTQVTIDLSKILVVKVLTFFFLCGIYNLCLL